MLISIEVWNFECHAHSLFEDLAPGLNLIFGESDVGKTSAVRALRLAAYNDFDPRCVRSGQKNCRVKVVSDKGYVDVKRGTINEWTVCRNGETPQVYEKIGKAILPQAAEVLGLHVIELGDMSLPVNIMDQSEGHFMLNELGGDNASGSMRAQIVDEISGLSGIEGLIKEVSLDRHRFGRSMKENEDSALKLRESMHDKGELEAEGKLLIQVEELVNENKTATKSIEVLADLFEEHHNAKEESEEIDSQMKAMPNTKALKTILGQAEEVYEESEAMRVLHQEHLVAAKVVEDMERELQGMPDLKASAKAIEDCEKAIRKGADNMKKLHQEHTQARHMVEDIERELQGMPDLKKSAKAIEDCEKAIRKAANALAQAGTLSYAIETMEQTESDLIDAEKDLIIATNERNAALSEIDVCPLSDRPISKSCLEQIKYPVMEEVR